MRRSFSTVALILLSALCAPTSHAEHRVALLIGNGDYPKAPLASPPNDIRAVGDALKRRGFTVTLLENLKAKEMKEAFASFAGTVPTKGTALVYFSGYALPEAKPDSPNADDALLPIDGNPLHEGTVAISQTGISRLMSLLAKDSGSARNILIVDGCYAHPAQSKGLKAGLIKPTKIGTECLTVFAAPFNEVIEASSTGTSPCAQKLVEGLKSTRTLDKVLDELSATKVSTLENLHELASPPSKPLTTPAQLINGTKPGDEWVSERGMIFCWCPPGRFTMGSPPDRPAHQDDESPIEIEFKDGFWIGKFEFTRREMLSMRPGVYLSTGEHKLHPLNKIHEAKDVESYLTKLNETAPAGWIYDVPTEAEWEYAARAGSRTDYSFGDNPADLAKHGNFADRTLRESTAFGELPKSWKEKGPDAKIYFGDRQTGIFTYAHKQWSDGFATMAPVGSFPPNSWGLHDVHGNLAEWTATQYHPTRLTPEKPDPNFGVVTKGGAWLSTAEYCRSAMRTWAVIPENGVGLRFILRRKPQSPPSPIESRWTALIPSDFESESGATATIASDGSVLVNGKPVKDTYTLKATIPQGIQPKAIKLETLTDPALPKQGPGRSPDGTFMLSEIRMLFGAKRSDPPKIPVRVLDANATFQQPGTRVADAVDGVATPNTGWAISGGAGKEQSATFIIAPPSRNGADGAIWMHPSETLSPSSGAPLLITLEHLSPATIGKFRISVLHEVSKSGEISRKPNKK